MSVQSAQNARGDVPQLDANAFALRLRFARGALKLTQSELAIRLGISQSEYASFEQALAFPSAPVLSTLTVIGVSAYWLLAAQFPILIGLDPSLHGRRQGPCLGTDYSRLTFDDVWCLAEIGCDTLLQSEQIAALVKRRRGLFDRVRSAR